MTVDNPYWDKVKDYVYENRRPWATELQVDPMRNPDGSYRRDLRGRREELISVSRHTLVREFSWTIPDPATLAFIRKWAGKFMIDPLAGTGYWSNLLYQMGVDIISSDKAPGTNPWHRGAALYGPVFQMDAVDAVQLYNNRRDLFLSWIPYGSPIGSKILDVYRGNRIIYVGESWGGCCADDDFFNRLERGWDEVAYHRPVQWFGMHDFVTIYERKSISA